MDSEWLKALLIVTFSFDEHYHWLETVFHFFFSYFTTLVNKSGVVLHLRARAMGLV